MFRLLIFCISITVPITAQITKQRAEERIIGGKETTSTQIPFQVSLSKKDRFICGGSIISKSFILTAAHCTERDPEPSHYKVRTGSSVTKQNGQLHNVTRIIPHENYQHNIGIHNDICLLQIYPPVSFDSKQQPVVLATDAGSLRAGYIVSVSGFGKPSEKEPATERLKVADLPIIAWNKCRNFYQKEKITTVTKDVICAGVKNNSLNSCQGDSGGPLFTKSKIQVGIVSWGIGCTKPLYPGVYTNVSFFKNWITNNLAEVGEVAKFRSCSEPMNTGYRGMNDKSGQGRHKNGPQDGSNKHNLNYDKPVSQSRYYPAYKLYPGQLSYLLNLDRYLPNYFRSSYYRSPNFHSRPFINSFFRLNRG